MNQRYVPWESVPEARLPGESDRSAQRRRRWALCLVGVGWVVLPAAPAATLRLNGAGTWAMPLALVADAFGALAIVIGCGMTLGSVGTR